jgi:branched-chain amino acid transport system substrate-binding protein
MSSYSFSSRRNRKGASALAILAAAALVLSGCSAVDNGGSDSGELTLKLGTALPRTGNLAFLGPPEEAGVQLAIDEINAANKGIKIEVTYGDSGSVAEPAFETEIPRLLAAGVTAIIGAASSSTTLAFIDRVVGAGVLLFSPANTSAQLTTFDDKGLYFRTAPSDVLQGEVLGNLIAADGHEKIAMIVLNDAYGLGLADFTQEAFEAAGGEVLARPTYNGGDTNFTSQIAEVLAVDPDAIVLVTFEEVKTIVPELTSQFPGDKLYFVDGNLAQFGDEFEPGTIEGAKGTLPGLSVDSIGPFTERMNAAWVAGGNPDLDGEFSYGAESYDAVILIALAALAAGSTAGADIAGKLQEVSGGGGGGTKCTTFADCADIINGGGVADYDGISGPITFDDVGDPQDATIGVYQFGKDNRYVPIG